MKLTASRLVGVVLLAVFGAALFAWSGFYSVAATAGHWPAVGWLLRYTMKNSVETHALLIEAPALGDPALIERGAGHYETGCAPCHGAPGRAQDRVSRSMLPEPPLLPPRVADWDNEELFWLVKHGLKYTGMPAWPAQGRDDEVWAVTAFLRRLPGMHPGEYSEAANRVPPGAAVASSGIVEASLIGACARCHGLDGKGRPSGAFPRLDIQTPEYLYRALRDYAAGRRSSGIMEPVAAALDEIQTQRLAQHFSEAGAAPVSAPAEDVGSAVQALRDRGLELAAIGAPDNEVPPCGACHGLEDGPRNALFPALNGQYAGHIRLQLELWKAGKRGTGPYAQVMESIAARLSTEDMEGVARYYASLSPTHQSPGDAGENVTPNGPP